MKIQERKWVVVTVSNPIKFLDCDGELQNDIHNSLILNSESEANRYRLGCLDEPDLFKVIPLDITYEF